MKKTLLSVALVVAGATTFAQTTAGSIMLGGNIGFDSQSSKSETTTTPTPSPAPVAAPDQPAATNFNLNLNGSYFVIDGLAVGLNIGFSTGNSPVSQVDKNGTGTTYVNIDNTKSSFNIGLMGAKYMSISENFFFYAGLGLNYTSGTQTGNHQVLTDITKPFNASTNPYIIAKDATTSGSLSGFGVSIFPGLAYFPTKNWAISFQLNNILNFTSTTLTSDDGGAGTAANPKNEYKTTNTGFGVGAGLTPTLGIAYVIAK